MIEDSSVTPKGVFVDDDKCDEVPSNTIASFTSLCIRALKVVDLVTRTKASAALSVWY